MVTVEELKEAAFWDRWICLECGETCEDDETEIGVVPCPTCRDEPLMQRAVFILGVLERVMP